MQIRLQSCYGISWTITSCKLTPVYVVNCSDKIILLDSYHCTYTQKVEDVQKWRDKEAMDTFDCQGWLHITVADGIDAVTIKLRHDLDHVPYCPIDIPQDVVGLVQANGNLTPSRVCFGNCLSAHITTHCSIRFGP